MRDEHQGALLELYRRNQKVSALLDGLMPHQREFVQDGNQMKAVWGDRRAAKSWALATALFITAIENPGCSCLYLGLTKGTVIQIMNKDILAKLNEKYQIGAWWNFTKCQWELPNGSIIYLKGADCNEYQMAKFVGSKYRMAVLDECSKYRQNLHKIVYESLLPAMGDDMGQVILAGTPSNNIRDNLFYDVTNDLRQGWGVYKFSWRQNLVKLANIAATHSKILADNPLIINTPGYKQEWDGQWVIDSEARVYDADANRNTVKRLPKDLDDYTYVLGIDLGWKDATTLVVAAYEPHDPNIYFVQAISKTKLLQTELAALIRSLWRAPEIGCTGLYEFSAMVCDCGSLGLSIVENLRSKGFPIEAAEKTYKKGNIEIFNAELITARIKVLPAANALFDQWETLIWNERMLKRLPPKWEEDERKANDLCDAALYAFRAIRHFYEEPAAPRPDRTSVQYLDEQIKKEIAANGRRDGQGPIVDHWESFFRHNRGF